MGHRSSLNYQLNLVLHALLSTAADVWPRGVSRERQIGRHGVECPGLIFYSQLLNKVRRFLCYYLDKEFARSETR